MEETLHAALTRSAFNEVISEAELLPRQFITAFNAMPNIGLILNANRQILFGNETLIKSLGLRNLNEAFGRRPGEILQCIHAGKTEMGCSAAEECRYCGAVRVMIESQLGDRKESGECRISSRIDGRSVAFDLRVTCTPFHHWGHDFYLVVIEDISALKQKQLLERTFLHDLTNSATGLVYTAALLQHCSPQKHPRYINHLNEQCHALIDEIQAHRDLLAAENDTLQTRVKEFSPRQLIETELENFRLIFSERRFCLDPASEEFLTCNDSRLVRRILVNLLKNAAEAETTGEISAGCRQQQGKLLIWVKNPAVMPREVSSQIFQRNFSTKDVGRGIGTYSVKLLAEKYLRGAVDFVSNPEVGTIFQVNLPLNRGGAQSRTVL